MVFFSLADMDAVHLLESLNIDPAVAPDLLRFSNGGEKEPRRVVDGADNSNSPTHRNDSPKTPGRLVKGSDRSDSIPMDAHPSRRFVVILYVARQNFISALFAYR